MTYILKDSVSTVSREKEWFFIPSRRSWSPVVNNEMSFDNVKYSLKNQSSYLRQTIDNISINNQIADLFRSIEEDDSKMGEFTKRMRAVFRSFDTFSTAFDGSRRFIEYCMNDGNSTRHRVDFLGDGLGSVMYIIGAIMVTSPTGAPIVIDEPELSLHPLAQRRLCEQLGDLARTTQIILATHNPYFVNWKFIENGAQVNRLTKPSHEGTRINHLESYSTYKELIKGGNWEQPFMMDEISKEIFFEDNILFTEGQTDVGLLRSESSLSPDINIFGYGVRGCEKFPIALKMAKDLGLQKVVVLVDGDVDIRKVKRWRRDYPEYRVVQWDKTDIHDKYESIPRVNDGVIIKVKKADGYFTKNGKKKKDKELGDYYEKIKEINEYFEKS